MELKNRKVVVTGGGSGYGKGIAAAFVAAGAEVWITGRNREKLVAAATEIGALAFVADASHGEDWDRLFAEVGDVDVLINNAGFGGKIALLAEHSDMDIESVIATNLTGVILGCRRVAKLMAARGSGTIVNISSVCAQYAWPGWSVYTAAKAGLSKFSHALYTEMRPFGVRVCCVTPSWGQTNFNRACGIAGASEDPQLTAKCIAPDDIGQLVVNMVELPDHLTMPDVTLQPMIQAIEPM